MAKLSDLVSRETIDHHNTGAGANAWYAEIVAPAPTHITDPLYVNIVDMSFLQENKIGPCMWDAKIYGLTGMTFPQVGDSALVIFDNRQNAWVVSIWQT